MQPKHTKKLTQRKKYKKLKFPARSKKRSEKKLSTFDSGNMFWKKLKQPKQPKQPFQPNKRNNPNNPLKITSNFQPKQTLIHVCLKEFETTLTTLPTQTTQTTLETTSNFFSTQTNLDPRLLKRIFAAALVVVSVGPENVNRQIPLGWKNVFLSVFLEIFFKNYLGWKNRILIGLFFGGKQFFFQKKIH